MAAVVIGFAGVALLLPPGWGGPDLFARLVGLMSGVFAALAYLNVRALGREGEPEWRVVFYFALMSTLGGAVWMAGEGFVVPRAADLPLLLAMGATATLAQLAMTRAYRVGNTLAVGALAYSTVGFSALSGEIRRFLEDGDEVVFKGYRKRRGFARIGFGECRGRAAPAAAWPTGTTPSPGRGRPIVK